MFVESEPHVLTPAPEVLPPMVEETDEVLSLLERGLERISKPWGWMKDDAFRRYRGRPYPAFCAIGAIQIEVSEDGHAHAALSVGPGHLNALGYIGKAIERQPALIPTWNDDRSRRKVEVLDAFKKAIRLRKGDLARG